MYRLRGNGAIQPWPDVWLDGMFSGGKHSLKSLPARARSSGWSGMMSAPIVSIYRRKAGGYVSAPQSSAGKVPASPMPKASDQELLEDAIHKVGASIAEFSKAGGQPSEIVEILAAAEEMLIE